MAYRPTAKPKLSEKPRYASACWMLPLRWWGGWIWGTLHAGRGYGRGIATGAVYLHFPSTAAVRRFSHCYRARSGGGAQCRPGCRYPAQR